jgi:GLPGLI family protein
VRKLILFIFIATSGAILSGCAEAERPTIKEGKILYDITYPKPFEDKWLERLMPDEMEMYFSPNGLKTELTFGLGMIQIGFLTNHSNQELHELLKFMKKKNYATRQSVGIKELMKDIPEHKFTMTQDTQTIAGVLCKKARVKVLAKDPYEFDCWYTEEIGITNPNWGSPFEPIKGVLMEYEVERFNVMMHFKANEIQRNPIAPEEFKVPENYEKISTDEMQKTLEELKDI